MTVLKIKELKQQIVNANKNKTRKDPVPLLVIKADDRVPIEEGQILDGKSSAKFEPLASQDDPIDLCSFRKKYEPFSLLNVRSEQHLNHQGAKIFQRSTLKKSTSLAPLHPMSKPQPNLILPNSKAGSTDMPRNQASKI